MEFSLDDNRSGYGSSVLLSPEIVAIRSKLIEACDGKTFSETTEFLKQLLDKEQDEQKRLGILAARVLILRQRVSHIQQKQDASHSSQFIAENKNLNVVDEEINSDNEVNMEDDTSWVRLRITENSIVKGVRFPKGVIVDVHHEEADSLIEAGKAEIIDSSEEKNDSELVEGVEGDPEEELASKQEPEEVDAVSETENDIESSS